MKIPLGEIAPFAWLAICMLLSLHGVEVSDVIFYSVTIVIVCTSIVLEGSKA